MSRRNNAGYSKVAQDDPIDIEYRRRTEPFDKYQPILERGGNFLHALLWISLALASWYYADIWKVIFHADNRINFTIFAISLVFAFVAVVGSMYVLVSNIMNKNNNTDYLQTYPIAIHMITFTGLIFWILLIVALWPVWGWKTLPIIIFNMMGFLMALSLVA